METLDIHSWNTQGYYILPRFYSEREIDNALEAQLNAWHQSHPRIVVDDLMTGERKLLANVSQTDRQNHRFKINDLYLELHAIRSLALNKHISPVLTQLLGDSPVLCNSLSFEQGSAQPDHVDSLYMTPQTDGHLIAIWVALEDCHADAGPLRYYPGSNAIPAFRFSNGSRHFVPTEMDAWESYIRSEIQQRDLVPVTFAANKGDVFIWSCNLLHGGSPINNPQLTRRSLVFHYYSHSDATRAGSNLRSDGGAFYLHRRHQPVDGVEGALPS